MNYVQVFFLLGIAIVALIVCLILSNSRKKLNSIHASTVGDKQHGSAEWMSDADARIFYTVVKLPNEIKDLSGSIPQGRIVYANDKTREVYIDTSNTHAKVVAPTESGKSTEYVIPNIQYNIMAGTTMIIPDQKGELYDQTAEDAKKCGYEIYRLNFIDPEASDCFDYLEDINEYCTKYMEKDDLMSKAMFESASGSLAMDIVNSRKHTEKENPFFKAASKGVIHSLIILLTEFGSETEKHIGSINNILQGMLQIPKNRQDKTPIILQIMNKFADGSIEKKHLGAAYAAQEETEGNIYASVLGDVEPFIDSIAEQILAKKNKTTGRMFSHKNLINEKCILYITVPETKEQFKVYATTIIRKIYNALTEYANTQPGRKLLKRIYLIWEEFGIYPAIDSVEDWLSIMRGRGILADLIYQSDYQIKEKYGESIQHILSEQCALSLYLALSQEDVESAERISKSLGVKTVKTGSVSVSHDANKMNNLFGGASHSITEQMMERPLMTADEILHMELNDIRLLLRRGKLPFKTKLVPYYQKEWGLNPSINIMTEKLFNKVSPIDYLSFENLMNRIDDFMEDKKIAKKSMVSITEDIKQEDKQSYVQIVKHLIDLTNDDHCIELLQEEKYKEFFQYMNKYKDKITKFELVQLLEPLQERE